MRIIRNSRLVAAVALAGLFAVGCDVHGVSDPGSLSAIVVSPNPQSLGVHATQQFTAVGTDFSGARVTFTPVWTVATGGGTIDAAGMFTASGTTGTYTNTVMATSGSLTGTATVVVTAGPLATIVVSPNPDTLAIAGTQQFVAVGKDSAGNVVAFVPTWSVVSNGGTITSGGLFTAGTVSGTFANTVQASSSGIKGNATVTVNPGVAVSLAVTPNPVTLGAGAAQQFNAVGTDANGNSVVVTPVWSVDSAGGAINASGLFTAGAALGKFNTIKATSGALTGRATITVVAGAVATITVTPNPAAMLTGASQQFAAVGKDAGGNVVAITPAWSVVNGGGTIVAATGLFTAGNIAGTFSNTVVAMSGGVSGAATVVITAPVVPPTPPSVATITVAPNPVIMLANAQQQFAAVALDGSGNAISITPVWSVVNGGGTINASTGLFTAGSTAGVFTSTIKATSGAISGVATVTVTTTPPTLATITVTPNPATLNTGTTQQFTAVGRDANGNVFLITPVWTATVASGTINAATGLFTAGATPGTYTNAVTATSGLVSGQATVIEGTAPVAPIVSLGAAAPNGIMAGTAVSCAGPGTINADVSISPGSTISGPCVVTGVQHLGDPTAATAQVALTAAYNTLAGLACAPANVITADLGGTTKLPGVYCSPTTMGLTGILTLNGNGDPNATFVFQMGSGLTTAGNVVLINGAQAKNVYWQVGSSATLGTASQFQGNILALTSITLVTNSTMVGRALARNGAVTLGTGNVITLP
jgi:hypothetical protein